MPPHSIGLEGLRGTRFLVQNRVAIQLTSPPGPRSGGPGTFVEGLASSLRDSGVDAVLVAPARRRGASGHRGSQVAFASQQFLALCRLHPDVVHTHDHPCLLAAAVAYRAVSRNTARVVFTSHIDPVVPLARWKRLLMGSLLRRCDAVTVTAHDSIPKLELLASPRPPDSHIRVIPGAATTHLRERDDPAVLDYARSIGHDGGPVLLQVSNFVYESKVAGTLRLLEAFAAVQTRFPTARLILIGTGPLVSGVMERRDRLGLGRSVTIPGVFIEDLSLPVALSDIHCHISLQDACPISVLEAMHAGKPVIASRSGGIPEIIQDGVTGVLVDDDPVQIAAAITGLLEKPERAQELAQRAREVASSRYTFARAAAAFRELYERDARELTLAAAAGGFERC